MKVNMELSDIAKETFQIMCRWDMHWDSCGVYSARELANTTGLTLYATRKAIKELREKGLVERGCVGCPAIVEGYEYQELVCEARPPKHGFTTTTSAKDTAIYKEEELKFNEGLRKWAEEDL